MKTNTLNDKELTALAAKAAGIEGELSETIGGWPCIVPFEGYIGQPWQPLHDDGDCARLEAALELDVLWGGDCATVRRLRREGHITPFERFEDHGGDKQAARRRAAVRAAAALAAP